jgi:hypothetical protein
MAQYGPSIQTLEIFSGNVRTVQDLLVANTYSAPTSAIPPYGQLAPFGAVYYDNAPSANLNGTVTLLPFGIPSKYRYVKYLSTDTTAVKAYPAPVFWVDEQMTTVSDKMSEGYSTVQQSIAGWLMANSTDISGLTITNLNNSGNGCGVFICVAGFVSAAAAAAANAGDWLIGGATAWTPVVVASGTSTGYRQAAYALTAAASSQADIFVTVESL